MKHAPMTWRQTLIVFSMFSLVIALFVAIGFKERATVVLAGKILGGLGLLRRWQWDSWPTSSTGISSIRPSEGVRQMAPRGLAPNRDAGFRRAGSSPPAIRDLPSPATGLSCPGGPGGQARGPPSSQIRFRLSSPESPLLPDTQTHPPAWVRPAMLDRGAVTETDGHGVFRPSHAATDCARLICGRETALPLRSRRAPEFLSRHRRTRSAPSNGRRFCPPA